MGAEAGPRAVFGEPRIVAGRLVVPLARHWRVYLTVGRRPTAPGADWHAAVAWLSVRPVGVVELSADGVAIHRPAGWRWLLVPAVLVAAWAVARLARSRGDELRGSRGQRRHPSGRATAMMHDA